MVFSSTIFLLVFLPVTVGFYYLCPRWGRNGVLLAASLLFYAWGEPKYITIMIFSTVFDYANGLAIHYCRRRQAARAARVVLLVSVVGNLAILGFFKYSDFLLGNINQLTYLHLPLLQLALPIGISFYTFQTMSYTIDVYRGVVLPQRNFIDFAAYVTLFPQLIAGPIVQYKTVEKALTHRRETGTEAARGMCRFVMGLGKKVLLANQIGALWEEIAALQHPAVLTAWLGALAFTFQIYFDFSGYSDMAIGLGHIFGFTFPENFRYPYAACSVTDFWRRWHISLSTWFREYVYIPLGGNRRGLRRQLLNILIVWLLTGLWHGASWNFVLWGLYYGVLLMAEKAFLLRHMERWPKLLRHTYACFCFVLGWVIFALPDFEHLGRYIASLFSGTAVNDTFWYLLSSYGVLLVLAAVGCTEAPKIWYGRLEAKIGEKTAAVCRTAGIAGILLLSLCFLVGDSYNPFLYFRF